WNSWPIHVSTMCATQNVDPISWRRLDERIKFLFERLVTKAIALAGKHHDWHIVIADTLVQKRHISRHAARERKGGSESVLVHRSVQIGGIQRDKRAGTT